MCRSEVWSFGDSALEVGSGSSDADAECWDRLHVGVNLS